MKTKLCILSVVLLVLCSEFNNAQVPLAIPYQAAARDNAGNIIANQIISVRFYIHNLTPSGTIVYNETHSVTTNSLGLFSVNIGQGTVLGAAFSTINWASGTKFLEVGMDPTGGSTYVNMGTQQMMSVPFAQYAATAGLQVQTFAGFVSSIPSSAANYVFAGPTTSITITSTKKITGAATAILGLPTGSSIQSMLYGLCYQLVGGPIINFAGISYTLTSITSTKSPYSASYSITLPAGTYTIGFGVYNSSTVAISNNDYVNGWIMITD